MQLMTKIAKEYTVRYVLTLVDDMLTEAPERAQLFHNINARKPLWTGFMNMLNRDDLFIVHQVGRTSYYFTFKFEIVVILCSILCIFYSVGKLHLCDVIIYC